MLFNFEEFIVDKVKSRSKYPKFLNFHKSWHFLPEFTLQAEGNIHVQCGEITIYSPLVRVNSLKVVKQGWNLVFRLKSLPEGRPTADARALLQRRQSQGNISLR